MQSTVASSFAISTNVGSNHTSKGTKHDTLNPRDAQSHPHIWPFQVREIRESGTRSGAIKIRPLASHGGTSMWLHRQVLQSGLTGVSVTGDVPLTADTTSWATSGKWGA